MNFLRDGAADASGAPVAGSPRPDVVVDASAGALQVTSDLLRRVEVVHGGKGADASRDFTTTDGGTGTLVKAWELRYETGPFDKSLLVGVDQVGGDEVVGGRTRSTTSTRSARQARRTRASGRRPRGTPAVGPTTCSSPCSPRSA